ncbi:uncharacterized protein LOC127283202 [Leptopilina boulardi]|uniref:uncharacterized protein LOC127283202 n=1 Tax=Leptopilina boulardi TaxID=63433 RepID=UPI0021F5BE30|nr:uncharacterized protein LOC127283202 [Leptopilina boulardi]
MKIVFLFIFLISSFFQVSFAEENNRNDILSRLEILKCETTNAIRELKYFEISEFQKIDQFLGEYGLNLTRNFRDMKEIIYSELETEYKKLNTKNENSESCYKIVQQDVDEIHKNITDRLEVYEFKSFFLYFEPVMTQVNFTIQMCNSLVKRIDSMNEERILGIENSSLEMMYLTSTLSGIEILSNGIKNLIKDIKNMVIDLKEKAIFNVKNCGHSLNDLFHKELKRIKEDFNHCITKNMAFNI